MKFHLIYEVSKERETDAAEELNSASPNVANQHPLVQVLQKGKPSVHETNVMQRLGTSENLVL